MFWYMAIAAEQSGRRVLGWVTLISAALAVMSALADGQAQGRVSPKIYALIIGIGDYTNAPLPLCVPDANSVRRAVTNTYPSANLFFLTNSLAERGTVEQRLVQDISHAPPGSLIIIYFAGHGLNQSGQVSLLMHSATLSDSWSDSVSIDDILNSILRAKACTAMIFLDCCFSGGTPPFINPGDNYNDLNSRVFMLTSSYCSQQTLSGIFTSALLQVWTNSYFNNLCLNPSDFAYKVTQIVYTNSDGFMSPDAPLGVGIERCFVELDQPACLLVFRFPNGCIYPAIFSFNGEPDFYQFKEAQGIYFRQVPKGKPLDVKIEMDSSNIWEHTFSTDELKADDLIIDIPVPPDYSDPIPSAALMAYANAKDLTAKMAEDYGAPTDEVAGLYADAIETWHACAPNHDLSLDADKLSQYGKDNPLYRLATGSQVSGDLASVIHLQVQTNAVGILEALNENGLAATISVQAAAAMPSSGVESGSSSADKREFNLYTAAANYRAAGLAEQATQVISNLFEGTQLSAAQIKSVETIDAASPNDIKASSSVLIPSADCWRNLNSAQIR